MTPRRMKRSPRRAISRTVTGQKMKVLVVDVGGTHVKILASGQQTVRKFRSGSALTPKQMLAGVLKASKGWAYEVVSIGYPGPVLHGEVCAEPKHLGPGWVGFDFKTAFGCPVRLINDAAMQALGSYEGGRMLFLGLGTGLGSALIADQVVMPMELAHLPYRKGRTFEDYVGLRGIKRYGKKKWQRAVEDVVTRLKAALVADDVVLGGGNAKKLTQLPEGVRLGDNAHAFIGGQRLWEATA
ncbi:MAG: Polyphosphate glucokinase [Nitrospira sp.]|nr:MAG: Polyphosphate glucokinase [Nitrospira sp.]